MADDMDMQDEKPKKKTVSVGDVLAKDKKKPESESKHGGTKKPKRGKMRHTHIEHHFDAEGNEAGHTVRHTPLEGGSEISYATPDLDGVHDGLEEHVGGENADEAASKPAPMEQPMPAQPGSMA